MSDKINELKTHLDFPEPEFAARSTTLCNTILYIAYFSPNATQMCLRRLRKIRFW